LNIFVSQRYSLKFIDLEAINKKDIEYLCITKHDLNKTYVLEKLPAFSFGLYYTYISTIETHVTVNQKFMNHNKFSYLAQPIGSP
jgi:hypothetical protein